MSSSSAWPCAVKASAAPFTSNWRGTHALKPKARTNTNRDKLGRENGLGMGKGNDKAFKKNDSL
jgi:hypothetical protein